MSEKQISENTDRNVHLGRQPVTGRQRSARPGINFVRASA